MADIVELFQELVSEGKNWKHARQEWELAGAQYELARTRLRIARERFNIEFFQHPDESFAVLDSEGFDPRWTEQTKEYDFVAAPIGVAARSVLQEMKKGTVDELAQAMRRRGYEFHSPFPAREVHAALVKQPWAKKKGDLWEYVEK